MEPGTFRNLDVPRDTKEVYVRIKRGGQVVVADRPDGSEIPNYTFNVANKAFYCFEENGKIRNFSGDGVKMSDFSQEGGFYKYQNGGTFDISGPLKYGVKTVGLNVSGRRNLGGTVKRWTRRFSAPGKVLFSKVTKVVYYGKGKATFNSLTFNSNTVTAKGLVEDGLVINSDIRGSIPSPKKG